MSTDIDARLQAAFAARAALVEDSSPLPMRTAEPITRRPRLSGWPAAAAAAALVAAVIGGTVAGVRGLHGHHTSTQAPAGTSGPPVSTTPLSPTATPAHTSTPTATSAHTSTATAEPSGQPVPGTHLINLRLTDPVRAQLVAAYVAAMHYSPAWVTGTKPGSVYYAYDTRSHAYLAWAGFVPSPSAPPQVSLGMQDGGYRTALRRLPGQTWQVFNICDNLEFYSFVGPPYGPC